MIENKITTRQLGIVLFFLMLSTKLLYLPSLFYAEAKSNAFLAMTLGLVLEIVILIFVYYFLKNNPNISLYDFLSKKIGNWFAKIIYSLIFIFFFTKLVIVTNATYVFIRDSFFSEMKLYIFLAVVLFLCNYMTNSPSRSVARTIEFFFPMVIIGIVLNLYLGFSSEMFQIPNNNWYGNMAEVFLSNIKYASFFGDSLILLVVNDKIKYDRNMKFNIFKYAVLATLVCFLLYFVYFGMFKFLAPYHVNAVQDITQFTDYNVDLGKLDIFSSIIYMITALLQLSIYFRYCSKCLNSIISSKHKNIELIVFNVFFVVMLYFVFTSNIICINFAKKYVSYLALAIAYLLPIIVAFIKQKNKKIYHTKKEVKSR